MRLVIPARHKRRRAQKRHKRVFRILKRLDDGSLMLFGFVPRYRKGGY